MTLLGSGSAMATGILDPGVNFGGGFGSRAYGAAGLNSRSTSRIGSYLRQEYADTISDVNRYLQKGDFDKAMKKYDALREHAQEYALELGQNVNDEKIATALARAGANFDDYIDESTNGSFMTGLLNGIPVLGLFADSYSEAEVEAKLNGDKVKLSDRLSEGFGKTLSGAGSGAAIGALVGGVPGAIIGGIIGTIGAFVQNGIKDAIMQA